MKTSIKSCVATGSLGHTLLTKAAVGVLCGLVARAITNKLSPK